MTRTYIIATHSFLVRVDFDATWQIQHFTVLDTEHHYGTTFHNGQLLTVKRNDNQIDAPVLNRYHSAEQGARFSSVSIAGHMNDVHQIAYANDGIYFANSGCNSLVYESIDGTVRHEYHIDNETTDINHINSVFPCGTQIFGLLHNRYQQDSELVIFEHDLAHGIELKHRMRLWHRGIHNVYVDNKYLYYNASSNGKLIVVDLASEQIVKSCEFPGHAKGLSVTPHHIVVGYAGHATRQERFTTKGYLAVLDPQSFATVATVDLNHPTLPQAIGNVNEVRALDACELSQARPEQIIGPNWATMSFANGDPWHRVKTSARTYARKVRHLTKTS